MRTIPRRLRQRTLELCFTLALGVLLALPALTIAQDRGSPEGEWRYQSGDAWGTRYSPLDQVDASNFEDLEIQWVWRGDNFSPASSLPVALDAELHRRRPLYRRRLPPNGRGDRREDG